MKIKTDRLLFAKPDREKVPALQKIQNINPR